MADALDREARFRRVCDAHTAAVLAYALRRTSREDAADVVAETFLVAWRRLDDVDEQSALPEAVAVTIEPLPQDAGGFPVEFLENAEEGADEED